MVGSGCLESAFALPLAKDCRVYAVMDHENPVIADCVKRTGGSHAVCDTSDPQAVFDFAKSRWIDYVFVSSDLPLANDVVDALLGGGIRAIGATRKAARIE